MCPCSEHFSTKEREVRVYKLFISTKITPLPCKQKIYVLYSPHTPEKGKKNRISCDKKYAGERIGESYPRSETLR